MSVLFDLIGHVWTLSIPLYFIIQIFALLKLRDQWRIAALAPFPVMLLVFGVSIYGFLQNWNLWPIYLFFASPPAVLYLTLLSIYYWRRKKEKVSNQS